MGKRAEKGAATDNKNFFVQWIRSLTIRAILFIMEADTKNGSFLKAMIKMYRWCRREVTAGEA